LPKYVAFFRAINVSGRYIKMAALAQHFETLGYEEAKTYINSGNVIFRSTSKSGAKLASAIESSIQPLLGFQSETFVRSETELHDIVEKAAGISAKTPAGGELNIAFLNQTINAEQTEKLLELRSLNDDFVIAEREVYWVCRVPQNESKFSNAVFERKLKIKTTFRRATMLTSLLAVI
jgi:uncharacterized protein (DUF1697 family)